MNQTAEAQASGSLLVSPLLTVVGFIVCGVFILVLCGRLLCIQLMRYDEIRHSSDAVHHEEIRKPVGIPSATIDAFPHFLFSSLESQTLHEVDLTCAICLGDYDLKDNLNSLPCNHHFHVECIKAWLNGHTNCPFCRRSLLDPPSDAVQIDIEDTTEVQEHDVLSGQRSEPLREEV